MKTLSRKALTLALLALLAAFSLHAKTSKNWKDDSERCQEALKMLMEDEILSSKVLLYEEINDDPKNAYAWFLLSLCQSSDSIGVDKALASIDKAYKLVKGDKENTAKILYTRSTIHEMQGNNKEALNDLSAAIKLQPDNPKFYIKRGVVNYNDSNLEKSREDLLKAYEINRECEAPLYLGNLYQEEGNDSLALQWYDIYVENNPDDISGHYYRMETLNALERYDDVVPEIAIVLSIDNSNKDAKMRMVLLPDYCAAQMRAYLQILANKEPDNPQWHFLMGLQAAAQNHRVQAARDLLNGFEMDHDSASLKLLGELMSSLGLTNASHYFTDLELDNGIYGDFDWAIQHKIDLYQDAKQFDLAQGYIDILKKLAPKESIYIYMSSFNNAKKGDYHKALEEIDEAIEIHDYNGDFTLFKAELLYFAGKLDEAKALAASMIEQNASNFNQLISYYSLLGDEEKVREYMLLAQAQAKTEADEAVDEEEYKLEDVDEEEQMLYTFACALVRLGHYDEAVKTLAKIPSQSANLGHWLTDPDMAPMLERDDFKNLIDTYKEELYQGAPDTFTLPDKIKNHTPRTASEYLEKHPLSEISIFEPILE